MVRLAGQGGYGLVDTCALGAMLNEGAMLIDLRDPGFYEQGHIPGALCYPLPLTWHARLFKRWWLKKLLCHDSCRTVIFYDEGAQSQRSDSAARAAVISGVPDVRRYPFGVEGWRADGLPLEDGACCELEAS